MKSLWIVTVILLMMGHEICQAEAYQDSEKTGTIKVTIKSLHARLAEGVVYVVEVSGKNFQPPGENPVQDQKDLVFAPHVQGILVGSTLDFPNSDNVRHNVFSTPDSASVFNLGTYPPEEVKHVTFDKPGVISLRCNVHAEMSAYLVVSSNPYFASTDRRTRQATIRNVPPGTYKVSFFHEKLVSKELEVTVEAGKEAVLEFTDLKRK
jgi:plastocyanin